MIAVLDASAAIEIILNRSRASEYLEIIAKADEVLSPDLYISEVSNAFWKLIRFQNFNKTRAVESIEKSIQLIDVFESAKNLYREAFALATQIGHPFYDCIYLVLARRYDASFMTMDQQLTKHARHLGLSVS